MNKYLSLSIWLLMCTLPMSYAGGNFPHLENYPSYRQACIYFFTNYNTEDYKTDSFYKFRFARKPSGWYIYTEELHSGSTRVTDTIRLWTRSSGFASPGVDRADSGKNTEELAGYLTNFELYTYAVHPFYGYEGWTQDIIDYYKNIPLAEMSDDELYGTGRAYSQASSDLLWSHGNYSSAETVMDRHPARTKRHFLKYAIKGITCFKTLTGRNEHYQTLVGSIEVKYHNEIMAKWYELSIFGYDKEADKLLRSYNGKNTLYDGFWNSLAKTMLSIPDSNAVLFTNGDNDTYPLLYAQISGQYREDIQIVNVSLLNDPVYYEAIVKSLSTPGMSGPGISPDQYSQIAKKGIYIEPGNNGAAMPFVSWRDEVLEQVQQKLSTYSLVRGSYRYIFRNESGGSDTVEAGADLPNYIDPATFILPSLVRDVYPERPVYFSKGCIQVISNLFTPENLAGQILVFKLNGKNTTLTDNRFVRNDDVYTDTLLSRKFFTQPVMTLPGSQFPAQQRTFSWLLDDVSFMISCIADEPGMGNSLNLSERYFSQYPLEYCGVNHDHCRVLNILLEAGHSHFSEDADRYAMSMLEAVRTAAAKIKITDSDVYDEFNARYLSWCISLLTNTRHYGPEEFYKELEKLGEALRKKTDLNVNISAR